MGEFELLSNQVPPGTICNAEGCTNKARFWFDNTLFAHCGSVECVEKLDKKIELLKKDINHPQNDKFMLEDLLKLPEEHL